MLEIILKPADFEVHQGEFDLRQVIDTSGPPIRSHTYHMKSFRMLLTAHLR